MWRDAIEGCVQRFTTDALAVVIGAEIKKCFRERFDRCPIVRYELIRYVDTVRQQVINAASREPIGQRCVISI